jgi:hypothetical protein
LAVRFVVPYFFWLTRFVIYISSYCSAHFLVYCNYIGNLVQVFFMAIYTLNCMRLTQIE